MRRGRVRDKAVGGKEWKDTSNKHVKNYKNKQIIDLLKFILSVWSVPLVSNCPM